MNERQLTERKPTPQPKGIQFDDWYAVCTWLDGLAATLEAKRIQTKNTAKERGTKMLDGQIKYYKHQVATINWVRSLIEQSNQES